MKKQSVIKRVLIAVLALAVFFSAAPQSVALAKDALGNLTKKEMQSARTLKVNKTTYYDLMNNEHNIDQSDNEELRSYFRTYMFVYQVPREVYMTYEIRVGGKSNSSESFDSFVVTLYDQSGKELWSKYNFKAGEYDSKTKETVFKLRDSELVKSERYIEIHFIGCKKDTYVKCTLTPRIPRAERINEIKKAGAGSVFIRWSKTTAANGYEIYRAELKNGKYTKIKTVKGGAIKCTLTGVKKNKIYYYKVKAYRIINGKKYYSNTASIKAFTLK